jgi:hypothetical protein
VRVACGGGFKMTTLIMLGCWMAGCFSRHTESPPAGEQSPRPVVVIDVPRTRDTIVIDGHSREGSWQTGKAYKSPLFSDAQGTSAPYTELRAVADDEYLYIELYVGDLDIESASDRVDLTVGPLKLVIKPKESILPPGVKLGLDIDDTIDRPEDFDEEWVPEIAIPWSLLGSRAVLVRAFRIDGSKGKPPHAMAWPPAGPALFRFNGG